MNVPYVSLTLARRYVTELARSPRVTASLTKSGTRTAPSAPKPATARQQPSTRA